MGRSYLFVIASAIIASATIGSVANPAAAEAQKRVLRVLSANTAVETGLIDSLAQRYMERHPGVTVSIESAGALAVLDRGRAGKGDLVITHHPRAEELFIAEGYGVNRTLIAYNSFAILGPKGDPLGISRETDILKVLKKLAEEQVPFVAPGKRSGTTTRLNELWAMVNVDPSWVGYEATDVSAKATIQNADIMDAYTFADLGTYFANRDDLSNIQPLYRDNVALHNYYSAVVVSKQKIPDARQDLAEDFVDFLASDAVQDEIAGFGRKKYATDLYTPAAALDKGLRERRVQAELAVKSAHITQLAYLAGALGLALVIAIVLFVRLRVEARQHRLDEERFRLAVSGANDGIWDWDLLADTAYLSPQFKALLGIREPHDNVARPTKVIIDHIDPMHRPRTQAKIHSFLTGSMKGAFTAEFKALGSAGGEHWLLLRGKVITDEYGKPIRMCGSLSDVTESKVGDEPAAPGARPVPRPAGG